MKKSDLKVGMVCTLHDGVDGIIRQSRDSDELYLWFGGNKYQSLLNCYNNIQKVYDKNGKLIWEREE